MAKLTPRTPLRADHRFIQRIYQSTLGGKVEEVPEEFSLISGAFRRAGGSWERVFRGSPQDIDLLKRVAKRALKQGYLTRKRKWGS